MSYYPFVSRSDMFTSAVHPSSVLLPTNCEGVEELYAFRHPRGYPE